MSSSYKPERYNSVSPYLIVSDAAETINFLERVFGATELRHFVGPGGKIAHAEVLIDDSVVMLADSAEGWPPIPAHVHLYVADVDATYLKALEAGAESVQEPLKKEDPDRRCGVKDSGGTTWWVATEVE